MTHNLEIRNIAIIAHVDHGKTTLTDALMQQTGISKAGDSMDYNLGKSDFPNIKLDKGLTRLSLKFFTSKVSFIVPSLRDGHC
jgi:GTP-binding protein